MLPKQRSRLGNGECRCRTDGGRLDHTAFPASGVTEQKGCIPAIKDVQFKSRLQRSSSRSGRAGPDQFGYNRAGVSMATGNRDHGYANHYLRCAILMEASSWSIAEGR
jgi:hypothetical protein